MELYGHANQWFDYGLRAILSEGHRTEARGRTRVEILHVPTTINLPARRVLTIPYRAANPFFQAAETVWILAGRSDAAWICHYNKQLRQFLDEGSDHFHGAYGERLRRPGWIDRWEAIESPYRRKCQLVGVIEQIQNDPGSTRAVASLHDPEFDSVDVKTLDRPCNMTVSYQLLDGHLHAATFNRSNDYILGLTYTNIVQFTTIQAFLAAALHAAPGTYTHFSSSLHLYTDDPIIPKVNAPKKDRYRFDVYDYAIPVHMLSWPSSEYGFELMDFLASIPGSPPDTVDFKSIACPYWRSVAIMLVAWEVLQEAEAAVSREDRVDAVLGVIELLHSMEARDWQIACMEYLFRWSCNRGVAVEFVNAAISTEPLFRYSRSVTDYITHDDPRVRT